MIKKFLSSYFYMYIYIYINYTNNFQNFQFRRRENLRIFQILNPVILLVILKLIIVMEHDNREYTGVPF